MKKHFLFLIIFSFPGISEPKMRAAVRHNILHHNTDNMKDSDDGDDNLKDGDDKMMFFLFIGLATIALVIVSIALFLGIMYYSKRWVKTINITLCDTSHY